jgi:catechol 2,3-dioxygenase-like lactoylglutathione lyase family enzyme
MTSMTSIQGPAVTVWPTHLRPGALRWARASNRYEEAISFYRDLVGLPVVEEFASSYGEDGTIFGLPDTAVQMEIVRAQHRLAPVGDGDQLVLYLDDEAAVVVATSPLVDAGLAPDPSPPAYWEANGAAVFRDPDGRGVVFAPWVYGRVPDPASGDQPAVRIEWYDGDRDLLRALFEEAEDSPAQLDAYLHDGTVLVARRGGPKSGGCSSTGPSAHCKPRARDGWWWRRPPPTWATSGSTSDVASASAASSTMCSAPRRDTRMTS